MDLNDARKLINRKMTEHGLFDQGWSFKWGYAHQQFGVCRYKTKTISLSIPLVELNSEAEVTDTILHEIAHALTGRGEGHGPAWKRTAVSIGCNGQRTYKAGDVVTPPKKWTATCPGCGKTAQKNRRSTVSCGKCDSVFNRDFLLTWTAN